MLKLTLFLSGFISFIFCAKLNVVRVLLPYNSGNPTNYTLDITEGGCYKWSSSRPDIAIVNPLEENSERLCSTKALVTAIFSFPGKHTSIIHAEDEATGQSLRCDVIVDVVHSVEIITTTRELFLEDVPVVFEVQGKNDQEDTFSSLEGVPFDWQIHQAQNTHSRSSKDQQTVLKFLKYSESIYETPASIEFWEHRGFHGFKVLMEGLRTGSAKVSVRPQDLTYKNVKPFEINLIILANLVLNPAQDLYLLVDTVVHYEVELIKHRKKYNIPMPSDQYYLELSDPNIGVLNSGKSTFQSENYGSTQIILKDKNIGNQEVHRDPSALIHVVSPSFLGFQIKPGNKWSLLEDREYTIFLELFDSNHNPIFLSDNLRIKVYFPETHFKVLLSSQNGTIHKVLTRQPGSTNIKAELEGVQRLKGPMLKFQPQVSATQDLIIYEGISLSPSNILLPWDPVTQPSYTFAIQALGGTGFFRWYSTNNILASVSYKLNEPSPKTTITTFQKGSGYIRCVDAHNSLFSNLTKLSVQPVVNIKVLPLQLEAPINSSFILPVAVYGLDEAGKQKLFEDCSQIPLKYQVENSAIAKVSNNEEKVVLTQGCVAPLVHCFSVGHTYVYVSYGNFNITTLIGCFLPLQLVHPKQEIILTIGSSFDLVFQGGPLPWPLFIEGHTINHKIESSSVVRGTFHDQDLNSLKVFKVVCLSLGEAEFYLSIGNKMSAMNLNPVMPETSVKIECMEPHYIFLKPLLISSNSKCYSSEGSPKIKVPNYKKLEILMTVQDRKGRSFSNFSSLDLSWGVSDPTLGEMSSEKGIDMIVDSAHGYNSLIKSFKVFHPRGVHGSIKINVATQGYKTETLIQEVVLYPPTLQTSVKQSLSLELVEPARISPNTTSVFNHPSYVGELHIIHGSGQFGLEASCKANLHYNEANHNIEIVPVVDESFDLVVVDLCLPSKQPIVAQVHVSGLAKLLVHTANQVEEGQSITAVLEPVDNYNTKLSPSIISLLDIEPIVSSGIVSVKPQVNTLKYTIYGSELGTTSLRFKTNNKVSSENIPIQVFSPLRLSPRNITLVVGDSFQVSCKGGPQPHSNVVYSLGDDTIAEVSLSGLITGSLLGTTTLVARVMDNSQEGEALVQSQDKISIHVVPLRGVKLYGPLTTMLVGAEMPIYVMGINNYETPFSFGTANPHLKFKWSFTGQDTLKLSPSLIKSGIQGTDENNFAMKVQSLQAGFATIKVKVFVTEPAQDASTQQLYKNSIFSDEIQIQILDNLELLHPKLPGANLLMAPNSQLNLKTNRDSSSAINYSLVSGQGITVTKQGVLKASGQAGSGAIVKITSLQEDVGLNLVLTFQVQVEQVAYLMINGKSHFHTIDQEPLSMIPLGAYLNLEVSFHNHLGQTFQATSSQLRYRPSRFDLIQVSAGETNGTLKIQSLRSGTTVLKVWDVENLHLSDYISVIVGPGISPSNIHVVQGQPICFSSPLLSPEGQHGRWQVSGNSLAINPTSGLVLAMEPGTATIHYSVSSGISTSTQVFVDEIASFSIDSSYVPHLTDFIKNKYFLIPISTQGRNMTPNGLYDNCSNHTWNLKLPLFCEIGFMPPIPEEIEISDLFTAQPFYDWNKGQYYCKIFCVQSQPTLTSSVFKAELILKASMGNHFDSLQLPLLPNFFVHQTELVLSPQQTPATLAVSAIPSVQRSLTVSSTDSSLLSISTGIQHLTQANVLQFQVQLAGSISWPVKKLAIILICPLTRQTVEVPVTIKASYSPDSCLYLPLPTHSSRLESLLEDYTFILIGLVITVVAALLGYRYIYSRQASVPEFTDQSELYLHESFLGSSQHSPCKTIYYPSPSHSQSLWTDNTSIH